MAPAAALAIASGGYAATAHAQWMTRQMTACTDIYLTSPVACYRAAVSTRPAASFGTDVKIWLANLQGAPSVAGIEQTGFSSLWVLQMEFRSSYGTYFDSLAAGPLKVEGGARQIAPTSTWVRTTGSLFSLYTRGPYAYDYAGIGGCHPGGNPAAWPSMSNAYTTCGDGSWVTYEFWTSGVWRVDGIGMMDFSLGGAFDDGSEQGAYGSQMCWSRFNTNPREYCRVLEDRTYIGLPEVATVTPEPASLVLVGSGMAGLALVRRRRRRHSRE